jgi:uncharacterized membrane-anchored protein
MNKVPEVTLVFWIIKIAATTLGETGGDTMTMTFKWGYLAGTALFLSALLVLVALQIAAKNFHPWLIAAATTAGTFAQLLLASNTRGPRAKRAALRWLGK